MKKGPLSSKEKEHITKNSSREVSEVAREMDRSESIVQKFVDTLESPAEHEPREDVSSLFVRNEEHGVTVMTESASLTSDENKAKDKTKEKTTETPNRYRQFIHKIKESE
jgi:hypothetical protein